MLSWILADCIDDEVKFLAQYIKDSEKKSNFSMRGEKKKKKKKGSNSAELSFMVLPQ